MDVNKLNEDYFDKNKSTSNEETIAILSIAYKYPEIYSLVNDSYQAEQINEIGKGLESNIDLSIYNDVEYNSMQMKQIRLGLENNLDVSCYTEKKLDFNQMKVIRKALISKVDISPYLHLNLNHKQLNEIKIGLEDKIDVSIFAKKEYNERQMKEIRKGLNFKLDVGHYLSKDLSYLQMREVRFSLSQGFDFKIDKEVFKSKIIRYGFMHGVDANVYNDDKYKYHHMDCIVKCLIHAYDVAPFLNEKLSDSECYSLYEIMRKENSKDNLRLYNED
ncbi:MAG: hypothetical protein R3Y64_09520 [Peptostreptococcaceae bacterium]